MTNTVITYFQNAFSTPIQIAGQIIGLMATLISLFAFVFVNRKRILATKFATDVLWVFSFMLCGAMTGAVTNVVSTLREVIFYFKKPAWKKLWFIPSAFILFYLCSSLLTWAGPISLIPMIASTFSVLGLWMSDALHTKLLLVPALILWLVYSLITYSVMSVLSNVVSLVSVAIGLFREYSIRRKRSTQKTA